MVLPDHLAGSEIERIPAPDPREFFRNYVRRRRPVILTGLTANWASGEAWTFAALAERYPNTRVVAAALSGNTLREDPRAGVIFEYVALADFVARAAAGAAKHYVMAPLWNLPQDLSREYRIPPYCEGKPYVRSKLWLGCSGTVTPLHWDVPHNLQVHLAGRKRWLLFAPSQSRALYPRGLLSGMPNFAQVDPEMPEPDRFPRFRQVSCLHAVVGPGDALFIPRGWWHHTRLLDDVVTMNFWWGGYGVALLAAGSALFKKLRGIRRYEWG